MAERGFQVRALGEIAIRCQDVPKMAAFYRDIIGLTDIPGDYRESIAFLKIADGFAGHTTILALFSADDRGLISDGSDAIRPATGVGSSLHHFALTIPFSELEAVMAWYDQNGLTYRTEEFGWIGWRGIFTEDPEGNTIELVAFDKSLLHVSM